MALPLPPINPNQPIPNDPFYYPEQNYIQGEYSPFIIGSGLSLDNISGVLSASGVGSSLAAGAGISLSTVGTITTIANTGVLSVIGTSPVSVTAGQNPNISVGAASTVTPGVVQLNNTTTSSSVSQALTAAAGYSLQQQIDALVISNNLTLAGTVDGSTGLVATVTAEGTLKGFTVGSALPAPSSTNAECFVIVTTPGTMTPTGGVATVVNQGDWWVSDGTSWIYYPVGFDPTYATTTTPGVVQLATNAEVQAGTESTHAVTSSALQSKLSDSVNLVSSTCIASSTAVKTANDTALAAQADATQALADALTAQTTANDALADAAAAQFTANAAIPCACYTAKGDLLGGTGAGTFSALSPGTDGQMLYALSSAVNGLQWANPPADIPCAVITSVGDIVVGSGPNTPTALPVGSDTYILSANSACATGLEWVANSAGDVTSVTGTAPITVDNTDAQNPIIGASVATTTATGVVSVGTNIDVSGAGAISVPAATTTSQGAVQVGTNIDVTSGTISVPAATTAAQGAVQVGTNIQVASGTISVLNATTAQSGVVQLNDTVTSTSVTEAGTANAVKTAYEAALNAVQSVTGTTPIQVDLTDPQNPNVSVDAASTIASGVVQLNDTVTSTSTTEAATANAVKTAYEAALNSVQSVTGTAPVQVDLTDPQNPDVSVDVATTTTTGIVSVGSNINVTVGGEISVNASSTSISGVVQLNDTTGSTSVTEALTANQGKNLQDQINALSITSNITLAGTLNTATGNLVTVTTAGAAAGFTVGSPLPAAAAGNAEYFVIVTVATTSYTPPGGTATQTHVGDWFLSDGTVWDFLDVGFDPPYASTTAPGVVQLATNAQVQAGTDATLAVTPTGAAATYVPLAGYTAKGAILAATAANTPSALPVGANGRVLYANSACSTGLCWGVLPAAPGAAQPQTLGLVYGCTTDFSGCNNTSLGFLGLGECITTGQSNVALGASAAYWMSSGCYNVAVGGSALFSLTNEAESNNVAIGYLAQANGGGSSNTSVGTCAGCNVGTGNIGGDNNAFFGFSSGLNVTSGCCNTFLGNLSGSGVTTGSSNVAIGSGVTVASTTGSCQLAIGFAAGQTWLTGTSTKAIKPGAGIIDCANSCGTAGQVLMSNGSNAICWGSAAATPAATPTVAGIVLGSTGASNTAIGCNALNVTLTGTDNVAAGLCALFAVTGGLGNAAVGNFAAAGTTTGCYNVAMGLSALRTNSSGTRNVALGENAARGNTTGCFNVAIGSGALCTSSTATDNTAVGFCALFSNGTSSGNTALGSLSLLSSTGTFNTALGLNTLRGLTTGACNLAIGANAACTSTSGDFNVAIGATVQLPVITGSCQLAIGFGATDYWLTGCSTKAIKPGAGIIDCAGSCGTAGQVLSSNGSNALQWVTATAPVNATPTVAGIVLGCTTGALSALGCNALLSNTTGAGNTAVGFESLCANLTGNNNTAFGFCSGRCITGSSNTLIGSLSGKQAAGASANVGVGRNTLCNLSTGGSNTAVGTDSMLSLSTGQLNTALGSNSLTTTTGSSNVGIGAYAGCNLTTGSSNVAIGCGVTLASATGSCQLAIGFATGCNWLTGNSTKAIQPGAGIIDCAGSCGTAGQVLTSNGSNAIAWATPATLSYTANKALTSGTPVNLLSWASGVRMGTLTVMATDNSSNVKWANITIGSASGIGSSAVLTQSVGVGNFTIVAGGSGETIVRFTPSVTLASVDFVYQYTVAFGAQPSVL